MAVFHAKYEEIAIHYNRLKVETTQLEKKLLDQKHMLSEKKLPKKYSPSHHLYCEDDNVLSEFNREYKELFFKHLHSVIVANTIVVQIKTTHMTNLLRDMEKTFLKSTEPTHLLQNQYKTFIDRTGLHNYQPSVQLQQKLLLWQTADTPITTVNVNPSTTTNPQTLRRKRSPPTDHPKAVKKQRIKNHFLEKGPFHNHPPI